MRLLARAHRMTYETRAFGGRTDCALTRQGSECSISVMHVVHCTDAPPPEEEDPSQAAPMPCRRSPRAAIGIGPIGLYDVPPFGSLPQHRCRIRYSMNMAGTSVIIAETIFVTSRMSLQ